MEAGKAMSEWADVLVLGKVTDQLIILSLELRWTPGYARAPISLY